MIPMRQRILVIDDDPSLAEMLTIVLRNEGFETAVVADGSQALTAVSKPSLRRTMVSISASEGSSSTTRIRCLMGTIVSPNRDYPPLPHRMLRQ